MVTSTTGRTTLLTLAQTVPIARFLFVCTHIQASSHLTKERPLLNLFHISHKSRKWSTDMPARKISPVQSLLSDDSDFCQAERLKSLVTLDLYVFNCKEGRKEDLSVGDLISVHFVWCFLKQGSCSPDGPGTLHQADLRFRALLAFAS